MRIYTVHLRPNAIHAERDLVFVREGFSLLAFLYPLSIAWALWHRLWLVAAALVLAPGVVRAAVAAAGFEPGLAAGILAAALLIFGFFANDVRRWSLRRRGFEMVDVIAAGDPMAAEQRFFDLNPDVAEALGP